MARYAQHAAIALVLLAPCRAWAYVPAAGHEAPAMPGLRAVVIHTGSTERLIVHASYRGNGGAFAWVIPLPAAPRAEDVTVVSPGSLDSVEELTAPRVVHYIDRTEPGCACQNLRLPIFDDTPIPAPVVPLWQSTDPGAYVTKIFSASESATVSETLEAMGYVNDQRLLAPATEGWRFVVIEVDPSRAFAGAPVSDEGTIEAALMPIQMTFASPTPLLPLRALCGNVGETDVTVLSIDGTRTAASRQSTIEMDVVGLTDEDDPAAAYEARLHALAVGESQPTFVVEYAGTLRYDVSSGLGLSQSAGHYVTRMRTVVPAGGMEDDLRLVSASSNEPFSIVLYVAIQSLTAGLPWAGALLPAAAVSWVVSRRRQSRWVALTCLLLALCVG